VDLMIATPGRLMEHIESTEGFAARLLGCQILILDEVDQLLG
jgi:superfamily II DNA/RNA helicase